MTVLPDPPESFFDGGAPQSAVAPGDTGRELLHDTKNLIQAINLLRGVVLKQRRRQRQLLTSGIIAVLTLVAALGYTRYLAVEQTRDRITVGYQSCQQDRQRGAVEIEILSASMKANAQNPKAQAFFAPRIAKLQHLQKNCTVLYSNRSVSFWSLH